MRSEIAMSEAGAARSAGHAADAAATAHVASHAANYAVKAARSPDAAVPTDSAAAKERDWQYRRLPKHLRPVAFPARGDN